MHCQPEIVLSFSINQLSQPHISNNKTTAPECKLLWLIKHKLAFVKIMEEVKNQAVELSFVALIWQMFIVVGSISCLY